MTGIAKEVLDGIAFDWKEMRWKGLTVDYLIFLEKTFPDADVKSTLDGLTVWLHNNRNQRKAHKKNWHSFLMRNMRKQQINAVL